ncbi:arylsulfatase [Gaetbulibacter saemankumensis]|uniref:arylsulfatase n=1 Tax=Gaetbulibacter saemankumensis TaxID=311208 RepID=UPI000410871B|nr:arylsulfatase [Gaetbulibacter saemankumensis]
MKKVKLWGLLLLFIVTMVACKSQTQHVKNQDNNKEERPNIIVIMADDLGFSDLGCYGGEIDTPNLDRLAKNGVRSNAFYNTSRCCPTRASLLTGLYQHQAGIGGMTKDEGEPGYRGSLQSNTVTIAEVLKDAGYQTGMTGKWHVSLTKSLERKKHLKWLAHQEDYGDFSDISSYPTSRGFDKYYGNIWGVVDYFDPFSLVNGTEPVKTVPEDFYYTNAIGDTAVAYVEQFSKSKDPFFLYVAHCAPHWPLQAPEEVIQKYIKTFEKGWQKTREARYERLLENGILDKENSTLTPFMFPELDWETNPNKDWDIRAMAVHAAMIDVLDQSVGKLLDKLEATGELDNTLILFFSDNGASYEMPSRYGPGFDRAGSTRDGRKVHFPVNKDKMPGPQTVHSGIGSQWSHTANTPFKYWKTRVYEGGINSPFIAFWPKGGLKEGTVISKPAHVTDIMATCLDIGKGQYPKEFKGNTITPTPGKSIIPLLQGDASYEAQKVYFWEHYGSNAIRKGDWKLVKLDSDNPWELYNLSLDKTENNNLASEFPDKVKELEEEWMLLAKKYNVFPKPESRRKK